MDGAEKVTETHVFRCASCGERFSRECGRGSCPSCGGRILIHESGPSIRKNSRTCSGSCSGCSGCGG